MFDSPFGQRKLRERLGVPEDHVGLWERGFPSQLVGPFDIVRDLWPELAGRVPIRKLHIHDATAEQAAEFVTWSGLAELRELTFGVSWESPPPGDALTPLASYPALSGLTTLRVEGGTFSDAGINAILDSPHLAGLKTCSLLYGYGPNNVVSNAVRARFSARFGLDALNTDDIPF